MLIDGKQVPAVSGKIIAVYNAATGGVIANVPEGDKADVDLAVAVERRAFDERRWLRVSPSERRRILWRIADLIERDLEELAELEFIDNGKPYAVARVAIFRSRSTCSATWAAGPQRSPARRYRCHCPASICPTRFANLSAW